VNYRKTFNPDAPQVDEGATQLMVREIMEECDVDHDGKISFDEFVPWYTRETEYNGCHSERLRHAVTAP
jgi:Ca2+-binding EF-hand superfamily protein